MLAGIPVAANLVDEPAAGTLRDGLDAGRAAMVLTIEERELILRGLEDCPPPLAELRGALVRKHEWRVGHRVV